MAARQRALCPPRVNALFARRASTREEHDEPPHLVRLTPGVEALRQLQRDRLATAARTALLALPGTGRLGAGELDAAHAHVALDGLIAHRQVHHLAGVAAADAGVV